jgi:hypothetical protein
MSYPDAALAYAEQVLTAKRPVPAKPFGYFLAVCNSYCKDRNLFVDFDYAQQVMTSMGLDRKAECIEPVIKMEVDPNNPYPHGSNRCADTRCQRSPCVLVSHPKRTKEWAFEQREKFLVSRSEVVKIFGEQVADSMLKQIEGLIPIEPEQFKQDLDETFNMLTEIAMVQRDAAVAAHNAKPSVAKSPKANIIPERRLGELLVSQSSFPPLDNADQWEEI